MKMKGLDLKGNYERLYEEQCVKFSAIADGEPALTEKTEYEDIGIYRMVRRYRHPFDNGNMFRQLQDCTFYFREGKLGCIFLNFNGRDAVVFTDIQTVGQFRMFLDYNHRLRRSFVSESTGKEILATLVSEYEKEKKSIEKTGIVGNTEIVNEMRKFMERQY
jgi:hypothetical protein